MVFCCSIDPSFGARKLSATNFLLFACSAHRQPNGELTSTATSAILWFELHRQVEIAAKDSPSLWLVSKIGKDDRKLITYCAFFVFNATGVGLSALYRVLWSHWLIARPAAGVAEFYITPDAESSPFYESKGPFEPSIFRNLSDEPGDRGGTLAVVRRGAFKQEISLRLGNSTVTR